MRNMSERTLQELEVLAGTRRTDVGKAAVRLDDLAGLMRMKDELKSAKVAESVTADDFNALVDDVHMLHTRLSAVVQALRVRRGR